MNSAKRTPLGRLPPVRDSQLSIFGRTRSTADTQKARTLKILPESHEKNGRKKRIPSLKASQHQGTLLQMMFFSSQNPRDVSFSPETNIFTENQTSNRLGFQMKFLFGVFRGLFSGGKLAVGFWGFGSKVMCFFKVK